eukprot:TRINITY_DN14898_c0_g1_i1.p1 TRINITY_DN14898_c0_g1~~TRINITY_DN14898_c0_g1_i1.p1  ORF type:complete len:296 (+),score=65.76 TRINITY_DN14898_c0_g1_i1:432-1319(+)
MSDTRRTFSAPRTGHGSGYCAVDHQGDARIVSPHGADRTQADARQRYHPYLTAVFLLLIVTMFSTFAAVTPRTTSIHSSYIEAYDTVSRRKLRPVTIERAHVEGLAHWATWVILIDFDRNLILLQKRKTEGVNCPGAWGISGEHLEVNESTIDTAVRGLREELNIDAQRSELYLLDNFLLRHRYDSGRIDVQNSTVYLYPLNSSRAAPTSKPSSSMEWPHSDDEEFEHAQLLPISTFRYWCEKEPERLCGRSFAHAYLKYLEVICRKNLPFKTLSFCKDYHLVKKRKPLLPRISR